MSPFPEAAIGFVGAGEATNRPRLWQFSTSAKHEPQHVSSAPMQPTDATAVPADRPAGLIAAPASPFQAHSMQSAQVRHEEGQRASYEQQAGSHGIVESRSWGQPHDPHMAPHATLGLRGPDACAGWREAQSEGDTPHALPAKRPKQSDFFDAHHPAARGPPGHGPLGEQQYSDDALSSLTAHEQATPSATPPQMASPWRSEPAAAVRATLSQSSEIGVPPLQHQDPELVARWTGYDAGSGNNMNVSVTMAIDLSRELW